LPQLLEVARALKYLHSLSIVHGDLKFVGSFISLCSIVFLNNGCIQTNVLIDAGFHARVMDFGLSTIVGPSFAGESAASGNSARWMGPEFVANLDVDETPGPTAKSDVYSFGRLVYAVRSPVFRNVHEK
jgi:serine/threonine protein kinase